MVRRRFGCDRNPSAVPASWTAIRDAIYNSGSPLTYDQLTPTQLSDWGVKAWYDCDEWGLCFETNTLGLISLEPATTPTIPVPAPAGLIARRRASMGRFDRSIQRHLVVLQSSFQYDDRMENYGSAFCDQLKKGCGSTALEGIVRRKNGYCTCRPADIHICGQWTDRRFSVSGDGVPPQHSTHFLMFGCRQWAFVMEVGHELELIGIFSTSSVCGTFRWALQRNATIQC